MGKDAQEIEATDFSEIKRPKENAEDEESERHVEVEEERRTPRIPLYRWVMHAAVMFGREFCYAMETALVTPVLLQIGLPEQYYSLTWFLSPILGLLFTPVIGSASDRCRLRWGRRRPFVLALCLGVLLGVALFLNGSLIGLSIGDSPNSQPIGIVLTVLGVVVLDFSADASEGPIRAYLLDVADTEEQDMALNIHGLSAGLGGAVGYMLGGLDWTGTALGRAFKSQEQVLFLFAGIIFIVSVTLHMLSIPERHFASKRQKEAGDGDDTSQLSLKPVGGVPLPLSAIPEEDIFIGDMESHPNREEADFLLIDKARSKSDSVLAMPDATIHLDPDLNLESQVFLPNTDFLPETHFEDVFKPPDNNTDTLPSTGDSPHLFDEPANVVLTTLVDPESEELSVCQASCAVKDAHAGREIKAVNGIFAPTSLDGSNVVKGHPSNKLGNRTAAVTVSARAHRPTFYRQPSFTFSYYGRVGPQRCRLRHARPFSPRPITTSRSLNDLRDIRKPLRRKKLQLSVSTLSSEASSTEGGPDLGRTVQLLWLSMFKMPKQLWRLCVCHLLTWFSIIAEAVFYTDFMGQVVYEGSPTAQANSTELQNYHKGVQMGCWGLVVYAGTAAACSAILQKSLDNFDLSIKVIYIVGTLSFSVGTAVMAVFPNVYVTMIMISTMGVISMSISYCPYALLGQYHEIKEYITHSPANTRRGFGIDCAILSCQVYISQILVASALGSVVDAVDSVRVIPIVASGGSFLGFLTAFFLVIYPDPEPDSSESDQSSDSLPAEEDQASEKTKDPTVLSLPDGAGDGDSLKRTENIA
ncbi:Solute carrier family 45 member 4 [Oryzias melastigma]|uniref:Solute carrier family 45 member 4 n=1 Tax=Oryzias melastigma TaxID=30732 RepID=A0A834L3B8_ORYME|nr:Solute carrier family 45 member 4 [Oryzias melastigma]